MTQDYGSYSEARDPNNSNVIRIIVLLGRRQVSLNGVPIKVKGAFAIRDLKTLALEGLRQYQSRACLGHLAGYL